MKKNLISALSLWVGSVILSGGVGAKFSCDNNTPYDCQDCWTHSGSTTGRQNPHCGCSTISCPSGYSIQIKCSPVCVKDQDTANWLSSLSSCPDNQLNIGNGCEIISEGCADGHLSGIWRTIVDHGTPQTVTYHDGDGDADGGYQYYTYSVRDSRTGQSYTLAAVKPQNNSDGTSGVVCPSPTGS